MSLALATAAVQRVWNTWGAHIPPALRNVPVRDIFKFHTMQASYDIAFSSTFVRTFRTACSIGHEQTPDQFARGIDAFVTADDDNRDRIVHVSPGAMTPNPAHRIHDVEGVLAHEYLHWLSHQNFYPRYYRVGGHNPFRVEGFTEWLMIECYPPWTVRVVYVGNYEKTDAWLNADRGNLLRLLRFLFHGEPSDLSSLHP